MLESKFKIYSLCALLAIPLPINAQSFLSNLSATKNDALYTTYAAALDASEFLVDEGYQFVFYDPNNGINFETDSAGNLCLAWKMGNDFRYRLDQMYQEPVIRASYSNLVKFEFMPFEGILVKIFFLVQSSRIAIEDLTIKNVSSKSKTFSVYPFFFNRKDVVKNAVVSPSKDMFAFTHVEPPDGWTLSHGVPHVDNLADIYMLSDTADYYGGYINLGSLSAYLTKLASKSPQNYCVEWGLVYHSDGSLCTHLPPQTNQIVLHNGNDTEILTEEAPKWGDPDPNIPGNGYQGCELGHFDNPAIAPGDSFTVIFTCLATGEQGIAQGVIPNLPAPDGVNLNMQLKKGTFPPVPINVKASYDSVQNRLIVRWDPIENVTYRLYRRTESDKGEYDRIAKDLTASIYIDTDVQPGHRYGYVVIAVDSSGRFSGHSLEAGNFESGDFVTDATDNSTLNNKIPLGGIKVLALQKNYTLSPGESRQLRIIRGVVEVNGDVDGLYAQCQELLNADLQSYPETDEALYSQIPQYDLDDPDVELMYWSAFSLIRQCMLPPEGECSYNYYVFSREPTWGWGHGGQVFHESLSMLAYVFMDPTSAMNSQRVYMERQWTDGYIPYRTGPYLNETIPYWGQYTTSAPWFSWENWEIYRVTRDTTFLREAYESGVKFYNYWLTHRDIDGDGLCEWGAHAVLECVRDGQVAVWDQVGWPSNFEGLDLNCLLVKEAQSLAAMARELGKMDDYQLWMEETNRRARLINQFMWDPITKFYYHVDRTDHDFTFRTSNDLKRKEIIGFLPMWAGVASQEQAACLLTHLTDPNEFWRDYGVPTLAADDPYYNPSGYWNGPVWVQWQYLIFRGLMDYGYYTEAETLAVRVFRNVIHQLKHNHWFWELYSPDTYWAGWNKTYIWTGLVARMTIDLQEYKSTVEGKVIPTESPWRFYLGQNYPNPFNQETIISYVIPHRSERVKASLKVYNLLGQEVRTLVDKPQAAGTHTIRWNGKDNAGRRVSSGVYILTLSTERFQISRKLLLLR